MAYVQTNRRIAISTPLGKDVLLLRGFSGTETISQLFTFDLDLLSENNSLKFDDVVGKHISLRIFDANGKERYWDGFLSRFSQGSRDRRLTAYRAQMVPWLWFLTRTADCRIFQKQKVPDIIQKVFKDLGFHDYELRLHGDFAPRDYCVQYRETDFNFVSRLMEEEGICYFFRHEQGKHVLVLANDPASHDPCPNQASARYDLRGGNITYEDVITEWHYEQEFRPGTWTQTDYNFETPSTSLAVTVNGNNPYEIYDFPGEHLVRAEGDRLARIRLQEQAAACVVSRGSSGCRYFMSGFKFTLQDHYRSDLNQAYLLTSVHHAATQGGDYNVGSEDQAELSYQNRFECIPFSTPFRPPRLTRRPTVQGCQTALVVGPAGEEIYTDKHGRVKVQFHWDREGKRNENSSCWVRVSHPWAGQGWGAVSIPRIGQEVIVDFLEGDPDQPIIVGRVYNGEQGVPFGMPGGAVVSGMKSKTHKGGGYNEISMNDTAGKELIQIHGQYDMDSKIGHDHRLQVTNNHSETIGVDKSSTVGGNKTISVTGTHTEHITGMMSQTVSSSKLEAISVAKALTIGAGYAVGVGAAMVEGIGGAKAQVIGGAKIVGVGAVSIETVGISKSTIAGAKISHKAGAGISSVAGASISSKAGANISGHAGAKISLAAGSNIAAKAGSKMHLESGSDYSVKSGAKAVVEAASEITLKCGSASIVLKSGGDILINGTNVSVKGSSKIGINASGDVTIKGSKIGEN